MTADSFIYTVPLAFKGRTRWITRDHVDVTAWDTINPALCIHPTVDRQIGTFTLTHKPTGAAVARVDDLGLARKIAGALGEEATDLLDTYSAEYTTRIYQEDGFFVTRTRNEAGEIILEAER